MADPKPKIRITRQERKTGMIDPSKVAKMKTMIVSKNKPGSNAGASSVELHHERGKTTKTYTPADIRTGDERYGKEGSGDTPDFIKRGQAAKQDIVHHNDKPYRAGYTQESKTPDKVKIKVRSIPDIKMHKHIQNTGTPASEIRANGGNAGKRRLEHVPYLEKLKRNKRTEAGN